MTYNFFKKEFVSASILHVIEGQYPIGFVRLLYTS